MCRVYYTNFFLLFAGWGEQEDKQEWLCTGEDMTVARRICVRYEIVRITGSNVYSSTTQRNITLQHSTISKCFYCSSHLLHTFHNSTTDKVHNTAKRRPLFSISFLHCVSTISKCFYSSSHFQHTFHNTTRDKVLSKMLSLHLCIVSAQ
jgi:hypothetical protein